MATQLMGPVMPIKNVSVTKPPPLCDRVEPCALEKTFKTTESNP